ncbi:hypothetical protein ARMGADRAFT_1032426 [Armillaria gallica]|uniref:Uncharacterized protein n=1 Tax=Armillaria gallica TaxID=47427 RepID=A0A2H3D9C3_ARMGA|nr:hypothetical protein ARMGADRAFT_1032426 [Armillaria gallica]
MTGHSYPLDELPILLYALSPEVATRVPSCRHWRVRTPFDLRIDVRLLDPRARTTVASQYRQRLAQRNHYALNCGVSPPGIPKGVIREAMRERPITIACIEKIWLSEPELEDFRRQKVKKRIMAMTKARTTEGKVTPAMSGHLLVEDGLSETGASREPQSIAMTVGKKESACDKMVLGT